MIPPWRFSKGGHKAEFAGGVTFGWRTIPYDTPPIIKTRPGQWTALLIHFGSSQAPPSFLRACPRVSARVRACWKDPLRNSLGNECPSCKASLQGQPGDK